MIGVAYDLCGSFGGRDGSASADGGKACDEERYEIAAADHCDGKRGRVSNDVRIRVLVAMRGIRNKWDSLNLVYLAFRCYLLPDSDVLWSTSLVN